jgi:anaerobic magnesium-protoporphyrin IX monomethyl ester cyclase
MPKEILLINPPYPSEERNLAPPLGIASVAGYLEENGYRDRIELIDGFQLEKGYGYRESLEMIKSKIKKDKPFVMGCSVLYTNEREAYDLLRVANEVGSKAIVGNYMAKEAYESNVGVTAIVRGEGEVTTKELMDALFHDEDLHGIRGVTFRKKGKTITNPDRELVNLDRLPPPAFHLLPSIKDYDYLSLEESRGCCFRCSFCSITEIYRGYRLKSQERIRSEVERIHGTGIDKIDVIGELVLLDEERALKMGDAMREFGCDWKINAHPTLVVKRKRILPLLSNRRLRIIETAVESGNQRSLDVYNKQTTPSLNEEAIDSVLAAGILPAIDFINFQPYLTMRDLEENIKFIMRHLQIFSKAPYYPEDNIFKPWIPVPRTPLFEKAKRDKLIRTEDGHDPSFMKMKYAQYYFAFKDEGVNRVADLIDHFLKRYGERYHAMLQPLIDDGSIFTESSKVSSLAIMPAFILCMAYALVKNDVRGRGVIDWYCQQRYDAIDRGDFDAKLPPMPFYEEQMEKILDVFRDLTS